MKKCDLKKIHRNGWDLFLKDPAVIENWFDDYKSLSKSKKVKSNEIRSVFKARNENNSLFVKYESPSGTINKLKARFASKAKSEFESAMLLEKLSIPCVEYVDWGRKSHESILISKESINYANAKDFWFEIAAGKNKFKLLFLRGLASFLKLFFKAGLYHPDFHIGNLLVNPVHFDFIIVDPYGIKKDEKLSEKKKFQMSRIIGALRAELNSSDACDLILRSGIAENPAKAKNLWKKILRAEAEEVEKLWEKRKKQILSGASKYSTEITNKNGKVFVIRNTMSSKPAIPTDFSSAEDLPESEFRSVMLDKKEALKIWLMSFKLQFHRIQHPQPLLWEKTGIDSDFMYWRNDDIKKFQNIITDHEFHERCRNANQSKNLSAIISAIHSNQ